MDLIPSNDGKVVMFKEPGAERATAMLEIENSEWRLKFFDKEVEEPLRKRIERWSRKYVRKYFFGKEK